MRKPPLPPDEDARLRALEAYAILDSAPEPAFDEIAELAAGICETPIALVSLVDGTRQWFKAERGLGIRETPREVSVCGHAILGRETFVIEDLAGDERFRDNPLVAGAPHMRFYAGAPLRTPNGEALGTVCVIDRRPRKLDEAKLRVLKVLAQQVVTQLELRRTLGALGAANRALAYHERAAQDLARRASRSEGFLRETIDALAAHIAIVDERGSIIRVNRAWTEFAKDNAAPALHAGLGVGANYLEVCDRAAARGAAQGAALAAAMRRTLSEGGPEHSLEYSCHSPDEKRWFIASVSGFREEGAAFAVVAHVNITARRLAELEVEHLNEGLEAKVRARTAELERALASLGESEALLRRSEQQLRALASQLQTIREEERASISREIHDELGQMLTALKIDQTVLVDEIRRARRALPRARLEKELRAMGGLVDTTLESVRKIARQLRPEVLDALGLVPAIEWQAGEFQARTGVDCRVALPQDLPAIDPAKSVTLFRIVQEALTNVARHAGARNVRIAMTLADGELALELRDDGRGIAPGVLENVTSLGLLGMRERARMVGGTLAIDGRPGEGTRVTVRMPLAASPGRETAS